MRLYQADDHVERGGFARAVGTEQADHFALPHFQRNAVDNRPSPIFLHQVFGGDFQQLFRRLFRPIVQTYFVRDPVFVLAIFSLGRSYSSLRGVALFELAAGLASGVHAGIDPSILASFSGVAHVKIPRHEVVTDFIVNAAICIEVEGLLRNLSGFVNSPMLTPSTLTTCDCVPLVKTLVRPVPVSISVFPDGNGFWNLYVHAVCGPHLGERGHFAGFAGRDWNIVHAKLTSKRGVCISA